MTITKNSLIHLYIYLIFTSLLFLLALPVSALAASTTTNTKTTTLESTLAQADHLRLKGENTEKLEKALALYQEAADEGSAAAQYWLGIMHAEGKGTEANQEKALFWIESAAEQDYPAAKTFLSNLTENEDEVSDDEEEDC